jgi:hypothetical protein
MSARPLTEGARQLGAIAKRTTIAAVAARLAVDEAAARHWIRSRRTPDEANRVRIAEVYGIPATAWTMPATPASMAHATLASSATGATTSAADERAVGAFPRDGGASGSLSAPGLTHRARLTVIMDRIEAEIAGCGPDTPKNHVASLFAQLTSAAGRLARIDGEDTLTTSQIIRSRSWREIEGAIVVVLRKYPGAADELALALSKLAGGT